jgi:hypothetical protein
MTLIRLSLIASLVALSGCARGPIATAVPRSNAQETAAIGPMADRVGQTAAGQTALPVVAEKGAIATSHVVDRGALAAETEPTAAELAANSAPGEEDPPALMRAFTAVADPPSYNIDDRIPYGVVVAEKSAHTATIAWRTEVPTRGIIEYGRSWGFDKNGFTEQFVDDVPKTDHMIALTKLRRFTGYTYKITAITSLGLKFPEQERKFRTKFWSWR